MNKIINRIKHSEPTLIVLYLLSIYVLLVLVMPAKGHGYDMMCWKEWTKFIYKHGISSIYYYWSNYLPLYHYVLMIFGYIQGSSEAIAQNINDLKLITLLFDMTMVYYIIKILRSYNYSLLKAILFSLFYCLNIAMLYNTIIWGQVDSIMTCFMFLSALSAYKKKVLPSIIFLILALNLKLQAIIFFPIIGLMILPEIFKNHSIKKIALYVLVPVALQILIILPFIMSGTGGKMWDVIIGSMGKYPNVSLNAYNVWNLVLDGKVEAMSDEITYLGISYKNWGLLAFFSLSFVALLPLLRYSYRVIIHKSKEIFRFETCMLICSLIPLLFFFFNTQMHERYSHPAFVFLIVFGILKKQYIIIILGSLAYLFNLDSVLHYFHWINYKIFSRDVISLMFLVLILWHFYYLFENKIVKIVQRMMYHIKSASVIARDK